MHPGRDEIMASMEWHPQKIVDQILDDSEHSTHLFIKNMAHHLVDLDLTFLEGHFVIFLIRDPRQLIASFAQVIQEPTMEDVGIKRQWEIFERLQSIHGKFIVIDSGDLLSNPEQYLKALCEQIGLDYRASMLSWPPGPIAQDGVWAKYWYKNIHGSSGFALQSSSSRALPDNCVELYEISRQYYGLMRGYRLQVD